MASDFKSGIAAIKSPGSPGDEARQGEVCACTRRYILSKEMWHKERGKWGEGKGECIYYRYLL